MSGFESLINLLVLMGALSTVAERLANMVKPARGSLDESRRHRVVANRTLAVSVLLALAVNADFFAILSHLHAPWDTLGWARGFSRTTIPGAILTGLALGFGSKFWHDALDVVRGARDRLRIKA